MLSIFTLQSCCNGQQAVFKSFAPQYFYPSAPDELMLTRNQHLYTQPGQQWAGPQYHAAAVSPSSKDVVYGHQLGPQHLTGSGQSPLSYIWLSYPIIPSQPFYVPAAFQPQPYLNHHHEGLPLPRTTLLLTQGLNFKPGAGVLPSLSIPLPSPSNQGECNQAWYEMTKLLISQFTSCFDFIVIGELIR